MRISDSTRRFLAFFLMTLCLSAQTQAHHALNAFYDLDTPVRIEGTLSSVRWVNPHISLVLEQVTENGETKVWNIASGSPVLLRRDGITSDTVAVGDHVSISGFPSKLHDDEMVGAMIHMADGRDVPMFRSLVARLGYDLSPAGGHISTEAANASAQTAQGIFRVWSFSDDPDLPEFEPAFRQQVIDARADYDPLTDDPALSCTPRGMPFAMDNRFPIEFIEHSDRIELRLEMWSITRTIHMTEGATSVAPSEVSPLGHSVGRWEGDTLIVNTTHIDWPYFDEIGSPQSAEIEVEERFSLSEDERTLDYQATISDPVTLLEPAVRVTRWVWVPGEELQDYDCSVVPGIG